MTTCEPDPPFYGLDGRVIDRDSAMLLISDVDSRTVGSATLWFARREVRVMTVFVPVDMSVETWGHFTESPACWISEIIGGPDDINGATEYSSSHEEALDAHERMFERAVASGCSL